MLQPQPARRRLARQDELFWAWEFVNDAVHDKPMPEVLLLLDDLLVHKAADPGVVGAGPLEDVLHRPDLAEWDAALATRCAESEPWRQAVYAAVYPDDLILPLLAPYLRPVVNPAPTRQAVDKRKQRRKTSRDSGARSHRK